MTGHHLDSGDDFAVHEKAEAEARAQGSQVAKAVVALHAAYPALPALELFNQVLESHRGSKVEFDLHAADEGGFYALLMEAFAPVTAAGRSAPVEILDEGAEGREFFALQACSLRFDLNGMKGREAWAAEFGARRVALDSSRSLRNESEAGRKLWDEGYWPMTASSVANRLQSPTTAP